MGEIVKFKKELLESGKRIAIYGTSPCGRLAKRAIEIWGGK